MVRLTMDLIARSTSGYAKKRTDESMQHFLKRLSHLYLEDRHIDEVGDDLSICRNLIVLYLYDNQLPQIPNLNGNTNLTHLYLQNNKITRLENLGALKRLTKLYIGGNHITVIEGLERLPQLQELHAENQHLPRGEKLLFDPRTLVALADSLQTLNISGNSMDTIRDLECLRGLNQFMAGDNNLNDMKEMAHILSAWRQLWRLDLMGNPLCHKTKYRDRMIIMSPSLEVLDGKEITETAKKFLKNWQANKEAVKRKRELTRANSHFETSPTYNPGVPRQKTAPVEHSKWRLVGEMGDLPPVSHPVAPKSGITQIPGYIMPAMPRKQFQDVLAKSASNPNSAQPGQRTLPTGQTYSDMSASGARYMNTYGTIYRDNSPRATTSVHRTNLVNIGDTGL